MEDNFTNYSCIVQDCIKFPLGYVYVITLAASLCIVAGFVLIFKVCAAVRKRRRRDKFVRHTSTRSSTHGHGGSYVVRTQEEHVIQIPLQQKTFEYVDLLAETPTTQHAWSADNIANLGQTERSLSSDPLILEEGVYDEPDRPDNLTREGSRNDLEQSQFPNTSSMSGHANRAIQRGNTARASSRSMPGNIINSGSVPVERRRMTHSQVAQRSIQHRQSSTRSMFDPLPDVPMEGQNLPEIPPVPVEPRNEANSPPASSAPSEDQPVLSPQRNQQNVPPPLSEKQFSFEDGSLLQSDIPSFHDPEISEEGEAGKEISIYSSQILTNLEEDEQDTDDAAPQEASNNNTDRPDTELYDILDHSRHSGAPKSVSFQLEQERSQPEGAHLYATLEEATDDSLNSSQSSSMLEAAAEALYDTPIVVVSKPVSGEDREIGIKNFTDPRTLFDDPGYTEGMMAARLAKESTNVEEPSIQDGGSHADTGVFIPQVDIEEDEKTSTHKVDVKNMLEIQAERTPALSIDSLQVLDYQDDELQELDPDIASCLLDTEGQDQQVSYV